MRRPARTWVPFGAFTLLVLGALGWVTLEMLELERRELQAKAEASHQESLRLALWRIDSRLTAILAPEAARPASHYSVVYAPANPLRNDTLSPLELGEVVVPSPLVGATAEHIRLYFQVDAQGRLTSPQVPQDDVGSNAALNCINPEAMAFKAELSSLGLQKTWFTKIHGCSTDAALAAADPRPPWGGPDAPPVQQFQAGEGLKEYSNRWQSNVLAQKAAKSQVLELPGAEADVGPLTPFWYSRAPEGPSELFLLRRVEQQGREVIQGIWFDWPALEAELLDLVRDLLPGAALEPVREPTPQESARLLATIPARLTPAERPPVACEAITPTRVTLLVTWTAVLAALAAVGWILRATMELGERRARFASAVTHELRTPLTTFKMYSQMLADGMVSEPAARAEYLDTLKHESERLARVVESVLLFAHVEEGRGGPHRVDLKASNLLDRVLPPLVQRASAGGMELQVEAEGLDGVVVHVDPQAVEQILLNLVDNSCKYAAAAFDRRLHLEARSPRGRLEIRYFDHGPGIPAGEESRVFAAFQRASCHAAGPISGAGLGLALARGLARALGGDLVLQRPEGAGACFLLTLPARAVSA